MDTPGRLGATALSALLALPCCQQSPPQQEPPAPSVEIESEPRPATGLFDLSAASLEGDEVSLDRYRGQVVLVVNVASECGYTPQYAGLQELHDLYGSRGLVVLGFPSNEFGGQEPGDAEQIRSFCTRTYGVSFPLFAKIQTKPGPEQSPVYSLLQQRTGEVPNWNFCKYLVGRDGVPLGFWRSNTAPLDSAFVAAIEQALEG